MKKLSIFNQIVIGILIGFFTLQLVIAQNPRVNPILSGPQVTPIISASIINNIFTNNTFDIINSVTLNTTTINTTTINAVSNFTQNLSVKGNATFNSITVTNQLLFLTNAFPLSAGTTWNLTKNYQRKITNADWAIT